MFASKYYQLLDFGQGEKLESFGGVVVCRETPSVDLSIQRADAQCPNWDSQLRFFGQPHQSTWQGKPPADWQTEHRSKKFLLKPTPAGQVGLFPEQAVNWEWLEDLPQDLTGLKALNLFGYTGGTTMALALRGARVTHVDASQSAVRWARANVAASGMEQLPIRWIVEDAMKFIQRESKRGNRYDILVADPPSFGKGPKNETWKLKDDILNLFHGFRNVSASQLKVLLVTCHTFGFDATHLQRLANECLSLNDRGLVDPCELSLTTESGDRLPSGSCLRYACDE